MKPGGLCAAFVLALSVAGGACARGERAGESLELRLDRIEQRAPAGAQAEAAFAALAADSRRSPQARRAWLFARGRLAAAEGDAATVSNVVTELHGMSGDKAAPMDALIVEAQLAQTRLQPARAATLARAALEGLSGPCALGAGAAASAPPPTESDERCDHRAAWEALFLLQAEAQGRRAPMLAVEHLRAAVALAERFGDPQRRLLGMAQLALELLRSGDAPKAHATLDQARGLARALDEPTMTAQLLRIEALIADEEGRLAESRRLAEHALALARGEGHRVLELSTLIYLSDNDAKNGRPSNALEWVEQGLPIARELHRRGAEAALVNNAGLARIALGQRQQARADLQKATAIWSESGSSRREASALREFGEAFAKAGDARTALTLYHRERELSRQLDQADREQALQELSARYDSEQRQRRIELLQRENALKAAELDNRSLRDRLWALGGVALLLAGALAALLLRRVWQVHHELARSQVLLRKQSGSDPLTGLANRRHFHDLMVAQEGRPGFDGTLLLIDVDHFKRINDRHGHAQGDAVLREVARRLALAVRDEDVVVRWGGEEFLIASLKLPAAQQTTLVQRLLQAIGGTPIVLSHATLTVTASIGHAHFPLLGCGAAVDWQRAIALVDAALYQAKARGRNRAVGIEEMVAADGAALSAIEADLAAAEASGSISLRVIEGPPSGDAKAARAA